MKNLFLTKTRWLVTIMLLTALGSGNAWGTLPNNPKWEATALSDIADDATVIIISNSDNATNIALPSTTTTTNPAKISCTVTTSNGETTITPGSGTLQALAWTLKKSGDNYKFYQEGSSTIHLYLTGLSSNTALRVNTASSNDEFVMGSGGKLLKVTTGDRYVGPNDNNGTDWRTYNSETATNYKGATLTFYVLKAATTTYTVTWKVNGTNYTAGSPSTSVNAGSRVATLPTAPNPASYCGQKFMGWTTTQNYDAATAPSTLFTTAAGAPVASGNQVFYAVFGYYAE